MDDRSDNELLAEYAASGSDAAFTALVERHSGLVHGCALRRTRDPHLAEEVSQTVFLLLAQKAADIRPGTVLAGWLFRATGFVARDIMKQQTRRQRLLVSQSEDTMNPPHEPSTPPVTHDLWHSIEGQLDELLHHLTPADRDALLLRHIEGESLAAVASTLGTSEDGARKRIGRALEKLRKLLHRRGITTSTSLLSLALDQHAIHSQAPGFSSSLASSVLQAKAAGVMAHVPSMSAWGGLFGLGKLATTGLILGLGVGVVAVTESVFQSKVGPTPIERSIRLPDHSIIEFQQPKFGRDHLITIPAATSKRLMEHWPEEAKKPRDMRGIPALRMQLNAMSDSLVFPAIRIVPTGVTPWNLWLTVVDREGRDYFDAEQSGMMNEDTSVRLEAHVLSAFPRRERMLEFRLAARPPGGGAPVEIQRFRMENPVFQDFPEWKAESLPTFLTNGDLVVVLDRLQGARRVRSQRVDANDGWHRDAAAYLRFLQHGKPTDRWFPTDVDIADATGNQYPTGLPSTVAEGENMLVPLRGALWPGEKVWELKFHLARHYGFLESEKLSSDPIEIPRPGQRVELDAELESPDGSVSLESISSGEAAEREPWKWPKTSGGLVLHLEWKPTDRERWLELLQILDDQGRSVPFRIPQRAWLMQSVGIDPAPGARHLRFVFATQKTIEAHFRAAAEPESSAKAP